MLINALETDDRHLTRNGKSLAMGSIAELGRFTTRRAPNNFSRAPDTQKPRRHFGWRRGQAGRNG